MVSGQKHTPVEENVWQGRVRAHVRHPLVHNHHDEGGESEHKHHVDGAEHRLPVLRIQAPRLLLVLPVGVLVVLLPDGRGVRAVAVSARLSVAQPVQTASRACGRVAVEGEAQLLQHVQVLLLQFADGHHEALDVPQHLELQWRRAEVILAEGQQAGAVQPVLVAQQVHVLAEALFPQPLGHLFGRPAADALLCHFTPYSERCGEEQIESFD